MRRQYSLPRHSCLPLPPVQETVDLFCPCSFLVRRTSHKKIVQTNFSEFGVFQPRNSRVPFNTSSSPYCGEVRRCWGATLIYPSVICTNLGLFRVCGQSRDFKKPLLQEQTDDEIQSSNNVEGLNFFHQPHPADVYGLVMLCKGMQGIA